MCRLPTLPREPRRVASRETQEDDARRMRCPRGRCRVRLCGDGVGSALHSFIRLVKDTEMIDFTGVKTILDATANEVIEYDASVAALADAKADLTTAQSTVNVAQLAVTAATESVSTEKADVVAGIAAAIAQLNTRVAELQE